MQSAQDVRDSIGDQFTGSSRRQSAGRGVVPHRGWQLPIPGGARRILVLGRQGSGKGVQCTALCQRLKIPHISAGDALRRAVRERTSLGLAVRDMMEAGELVPDELVLSALATELEVSSDHGFVLDGFPRTAAQARSLFDMLGFGGIDLAINIDVPHDVVISRIRRRRVCTGCGRDCGEHFTGSTCDRCGNPVDARPDDSPEAIRRRLYLSERNEPALLSYLAQHIDVRHVDGVGAPEEVSEEIIQTVRGTHCMKMPGVPEVSLAAPPSLSA